MFDTLWPILRNFGMRHGLRAADAEDVAQCALWRMFRRIHAFDPERDAYNWSLGITANELKTLYREIHRRRETSDLPLEQASPCGGLDELLIEQARWSAIRDALSTLTETDQEAVFTAVDGRYVHGQAQTSAERKRRQRALERLRTALGGRCTG